MHIKKLKKTVLETPLTNWIKLDYEVPEILSEVNNMIVGLIDKILNEKKGDSRYKKHLEEETRGGNIAFINNNVYAAGGFISDYIISKVHSRPFEPKDIDFFINGEFLRYVLDYAIRDTKVEISKTEADELEAKGKGYHRAGGKYYTYVSPPSIWDVFGEELKNIFPDCEWKDKSIHGYDDQEINVVYYIQYKGTSIEVIAGERERILNFDIAFRCGYYNGGKLYVNSLGYEDIKNKKIRILHSETPISTSVRMMEFQERYNFEIDRFSLMLFLSSINKTVLEKEFFLAKFRKHKKYSLSVEKMFFELPHRYIETEIMDFKNNVTVFESIYFEIEKFPEYKSEIAEFYDQVSEVLKHKGSIVYPRVEAFLKGCEKYVFNYNRPKDWYQKEIFEKTFMYEKDFFEYYQSQRLISTFGNIDASSPRNRSEKDEVEELDKIYEIVVNGGYSGEEKLHYNTILKIPIIALTDRLEFVFSGPYIYDFILSEDFCFDLNNKELSSSRIIFRINSDEKIIKMASLVSPNYFGLVGDLYTDFTNQLKESLELEDFEIQYDPDMHSGLEFMNLRSKNLYDYRDEAVSLEDTKKLAVIS